MPDLDEVFAYQTPKIVVIKDRYLGILRLSLTVVIAIYIFVYTMLYLGKHLAVMDVNAVFRLSLQHPTSAFCDPFEIGCVANYTAFSELPYCSQSEYPYSSAEGIEQRKGDCQIWDTIESTIPGDRGITIPTRIQRFDEVRGCNPSADNGWTCSGSPYDNVDENGAVQTARGKAKAKYDAFVADIEHFTLLIDHGFELPKVMKADDFDMIGYLNDCPTSDTQSNDCKQVPITCAHDECLEGQPKLRKEVQGKGDNSVASTTEIPETTGLPRPEPGRSMLSIMFNRSMAPMAFNLDAVKKSGGTGLPGGLPIVTTMKGDVFEVGTLLKAANVSLDDTGGFKKGTYRSRGMVIVIHIEYKNLPEAWAGIRINPFSSLQWPHYSYTVSSRYAYDYQLTKTYDDPADSKRTVRMYNGIRVVVEQHGSIVVWDTTNALVVLTAALGLLAVATTVTELSLMYAMQRSEVYKRFKFRQSRDMNPEDETEKKAPTHEEIGEMFVDAVESQDGKAVVEAFDEMMCVREKRWLEDDPLAATSTNTAT